MLVTQETVKIVIDTVIFGMVFLLVVGAIDTVYLKCRKGSKEDRRGSK